MKKIKNWSNCDFKIGAQSIGDIPAGYNYPEVAFAGRSNVGKSSLLNALTTRNSLVRTSKTPGCTRQLNFFLLEEKLMLVDMPGYGYAKASKTDRAGWNKTAQNYLAGRPNLKRIFVLIDSRHGMKDSDDEIMSLLDETAVVYQVILTKVDKSSAEKINKIIWKLKSLHNKHPAMHPEVLQTSAFRDIGLDSVREEIEGFI